MSHFKIESGFFWFFLSVFVFLLLISLRGMLGPCFPPFHDFCVSLFFFDATDIFLFVTGRLPYQPPAFGLSGDSVEAVAVLPLQPLDSSTGM